MNKRFLSYISLTSDEEIRQVIKGSLWARFNSLIMASGLLLLAFFLIYPLFRWDWQGVLIFVVLIVCALVLFWRIYVMHSLTSLILTNRRLIDLTKTGIFGYTCYDVPYKRIRNVSCRTKGFSNAVLRLGDIYIDLAGQRKVALKLEAVKKPHQVVSQILTFCEKYQQPTQGSRAEVLLSRIRRKLGEEKFNRLISGE